MIFSALKKSLLTLVVLIPAGAMSGADVADSPKVPEVIAHRGFWNTEGSAQNSRASLRKAIETGCYGSETDVWLTTDGKLMANHDASYGGVTIRESSSDRCKELVLANGEHMPELQDFLDILISAPESPTKLIIEIKDHGNAALNRSAATATVKAVKVAKLQDRVEYISFNEDACLQVMADDPEAKVAYLKGGVAPEELKKKGYTGLDYHMNEYRSNAGWNVSAHDCGMTTNVWTVTSDADLGEFFDMGVDYVTTDAPVRAMQMRKERLAK